MLLTSVVVVLVVLACVAVFMATNYVSARMMQNMLRMRQYNKPQAQYSDIRNLEGRP